LNQKAIQGWGTADSSSKCNNSLSAPTPFGLEESRGKDGKQRTFPTFPRHGYGYLYESIHEICCTWILNVPTQLLLTLDPKML
jgi:hypothetical protein